MKTNQFFRQIPEAPRYSINEKGEITNAAGFPVKAENGKVRLTVDETRKIFTVADLIASAWKKAPVETVSALDAELPTATAPVEPQSPPAPEAPAEEAAPETPAESEVPPALEVPAAAETGATEKAKKPKEITKKEFQEKIRKADDDGAKYHCRLNYAIAESIRARLAAGETKKDLAAQYGVKVQTIHSLSTRRLWSKEWTKKKDKAATTTTPA